MDRLATDEGAVLIDKVYARCRKLVDGIAVVFLLAAVAAGSPLVGIGLILIKINGEDDV